MNLVEKYESYCSKIEALNDKLGELTNVSTLKTKLEYEVSTLRRLIAEFDDDGFGAEINKAKRMQFEGCLQNSLIMASGGSLGSSPLAEFKRSSSFKELDKKGKQAFAAIKNELMSKQYNIQSAILIAENEPCFDLETNPMISDYINNTVENLKGYEEMSAEKVKKIKEIMYIFVEHVSI